MPNTNKSEDTIAPMAKKLPLSSTLKDPFEEKVTEPAPKINETSLEAVKTNTSQTSKAKPDQTVQPETKTKKTSKANTAKTKPKAKPATTRQRRDLGAAALQAAAMSGELKSNSEKKIRRSWGGALETLPKDLYLRGTPRTKKMFSGPISTYAAFDDFCVINNYTKWEAIEVLLRKGPDPFIVDE